MSRSSNECSTIVDSHVKIILLGIIRFLSNTMILFEFAQVRYQSFISLLSKLQYWKTTLFLSK